MPEPLGVHHVTILVTDLERSRRFYGEVLGLQEEEDMPDFGKPLIWYRVGATQVHLLPKEYVPVNQFHDLSNLAWNRHVALGIEDFSEIRDRLQQAGVSYCESPNANLGMKQLFFQDPDGNGLEFMVPASFEEAARRLRKRAPSN
jgi:catechol 2,3-dioxygenase-like lactoylglutathione lyase family enzyme